MKTTLVGPAEIGRIKSRLAKLVSKLGQFEPNVPRNTKTAKEETSNSWDVLTKQGSMVGCLKSEKHVQKCVETMEIPQSLGQVQTWGKQTRGNDICVRPG